MSSRIHNAAAAEQPARRARRFRCTVPALGILLALSLAVFGAASASAALPPFDGVMWFPDIHGPGDAEEYSWEVTLGEGQSLKSVDSQEAEVVDEDGTVAIHIQAESAHDADGTAVPTSLSVPAGNVLTLTVHHRAGNPTAGGAPFAYPVTAGPAFQIDKGTVIVQGPADERELQEARERIERENPAAKAVSTLMPPTSEPPVLFSNRCADAHYKPSEIIISCADARASFQAQEWTRWDGSGARARGQFLHPDCASNVPLVACRHNARDAATVKLYRVRFCPKQGRRYFTRLLLIDPEGSNRYLRRIKLNYPCGYVQ